MAETSSGRSSKRLLRRPADLQARPRARSGPEHVREQREPEATRAEIERRLAVLDELARLGAAIGPISGDPIAEARAERDGQIWAVQWGGAAPTGAASEDPNRAEDSDRAGEPDRTEDAQ